LEVTVVNGFSVAAGGVNLKAYKWKEGAENVRAERRGESAREASEEEVYTHELVDGVVPDVGHGRVAPGAGLEGFGGPLHKHRTRTEAMKSEGMEHRQIKKESELVFEKRNSRKT
jgi:hypothetical protein